MTSIKTTLLMKSILAEVIPERYTTLSTKPEIVLAAN